LLARRRRFQAAVHRGAELARELGIALAGIAAEPGGHLGGEERGDDAVLVRRPDGPVAAQEGSPRALLAAEAEPAGEQAVDEPLEADRDLVEAGAAPRGPGG